MSDRSMLEKARTSGDMRAYGDQLAAYYKRCSSSDPSGVCTTAFLKKHVVENGAFNRKKALSIARKRSKNYTKDVTSTIISKKGMKKICQQLSKSGLVKEHVLRGTKRNYTLASVEVIVIEIFAEERLETSWPRTINVRLGLDEDGFINHYETPKWKRKKRKKKLKEEKEAKGK